MGFFARLRGRNTAEERNTSFITDGGDLLGGGLYMLGSFGSLGSHNDTGETVTPGTALQAASVWACVSRIARDLSTLPLHVIDRQTDARVADHPMAQLLRSPNEYHTGPAFWMTYMLNLLLYGWAGAAIEHDEAQQPTAILPLMSRSTRPVRANGQLAYQVSNAGHTLRPDQIAAVAYMSMDGITGTSPITTGGRAIGTDIALARFAGKFFQQGGNLGTVFELPPMGPEALKETHRILTEQYTGNANSHKPIAIPGVKVHKLSNSPRDSQAVESRQHQLGEVARLFNMPIGLLDAERSKHAGLEAQYREYSQATLRPWAVLIEHEFSRKLFSEADQSRYAIRWNLDAIVRADLSSRAEADAKLVQAGILTPNEARGHHDRPPIAGGDVLLSPLNMTPAAERSQPTPQEPQPDPRIGQLITSIAGSIATKEANAAKRAANKPNDFEAWADQFFTEHRTHLAERLPIATEAQREEIAESARITLRNAHKTGELTQLLETWPTTRPTAIQEILSNAEK